MEIVRLLLLLILLSGYMAAAVIESSVAPPLTSAQKWQFVRKNAYFIQHRCSKAAIARIDAIIEKIFAAESLSKLDVPPLQFRFYANAVEYQRAMLFSKERTAHFNEDRLMILSSCAVDGVVLIEHIYFHAASRHNLRPWQRIFIAEVRARNMSGKSDYFMDARKMKAVGLNDLLLSNHTPQMPERAAMYRLAQMLNKEELLGDFVASLIDNQTGDDTGLEILEKLFPEGIKKLR